MPALIMLVLPGLPSYNGVEVYYLKGVIGLSIVISFRDRWFFFFFFFFFWNGFIDDVIVIGWTDSDFRISRALMRRLLADSRHEKISLIQQIWGFSKTAEMPRLLLYSRNKNLSLNNVLDPARKPKRNGQTDNMKTVYHHKQFVGHGCGGVCLWGVGVFSYKAEIRSSQTAELKTLLSDSRNETVSLRQQKWGSFSLTAELSRHEKASRRHQTWVGFSQTADIWRFLSDSKN